MKDTIKRYTISALIVAAIAGVVYGGRILWQQHMAGVTAYAWLASSPTDEKGNPVGNKSRAQLIDEKLR